MILTTRDRKQLTPDKFLEPKAGYALPHVCEEEDEWMKWCRCPGTVIRRHQKKAGGSYVKPCSNCGRRIKA